MTSAERIDMQNMNETAAPVAPASPNASGAAPASRLPSGASSAPRRDLITVVVPCCNEEKAVPFFYEAIVKTALEMKEAAFEFLFVDDGSADGTLSELKKLAERDSRVHYISFSRNFGKEAAIYAGLSNSSGDYTVVMDADLQDPPVLLPEMYRLVKEEGYNSVATRRVTRKGEPPIRSFFARRFYKIINRMSKTEIVDGARDFRFMDRKFVNAILQMKEYNRFSKGLFGWVGFKTKWLEYENIQRVAGETKWSFWGLFKYALEGLVAFTTAPLVMSAWLGIVLCLVAFIAIIFIIVRKLLFGDPVAGWPSLVCIIVFISGLQFLVLGVFGQYMAKMYLEIKDRPLYLVAEDNLNSVPPSPGPARPR